jgi:hypothetical protein
VWRKQAKVLALISKVLGSARCASREIRRKTCLRVALLVRALAAYWLPAARRLWYEVRRLNYQSVFDLIDRSVADIQGALFSFLRQHVKVSTVQGRTRPIGLSQFDCFPIPSTIVHRCAYKTPPQSILIMYKLKEFLQRLRRYQLNARAIVSLANGVGTSANPGLATG